MSIMCVGCGRKLEIGDTGCSCGSTKSKIMLGVTEHDGTVSALPSVQKSELRKLVAMWREESLSDWSSGDTGMCADELEKLIG